MNRLIDELVWIRGELVSGIAFGIKWGMALAFIGVIVGCAALLMMTLF